MYDHKEGLWPVLDQRLGSGGCRQPVLYNKIGKAFGAAGPLHSYDVVFRTIAYLLQARARATQPANVGRNQFV